jgi:Fe-S-cluster containining protein
MQPILKKKDIRKLSKSLNITPDQFKTKYVDKDEDGDNILNQLPCPFLNDNKCTQYDSRPVDCESYPHLHKKDFVFRLIGVVNNYSICPIVFNVYEALKNRLKSEFIGFQKELMNSGTISTEQIAELDRENFAVSRKVHTGSKVGRPAG